MPAPASAPPRPTGAGRFTRGELVALALVLALALGLRVAHVLGSQASPLFDAPQMDALFHVEWARAFAGGERFQAPPFFRAPLYPWFLGTLLGLFGEGLLLPRLVQALLGTAATLLVYLSARRAFGRAEASVAGLLWATSWVGTFFDGELLLETLALPLYLLGIWLSLGLATRATPARLLVSGLAWGLSAITRPNVLLLMPLLALWLFLRERGARGSLRALAAPALLAAGTLAPILPITAYNLLAGGDTVLIASQAGVNLWIGNNPASDGSTAVVPGTREDWWGGYDDAIAQAEQAEGRELRPSEVSRHYTQRALDFVRRSPGSWALLLARKLRMLTWNHELGNNEEPRFLLERFSPVAFLSPLGFWLLFSLGLLGLAVTWRGAWERLPLWGFLTTYAFSVVLFFVNSRFRLPLLPVLCVYAGAGGVWLARRALTARLLPLAGGLALVLALAALSLDVPEDVLRRSRSNGHLILGSAAAQAEDWRTAADELELAVGIEASNSIAWRALGATRRALGDPTGAEQAFREALALRPDDADALDLLADLLLEQGRASDALGPARRLAVAEPTSGRGPDAEGRAHLAAGDPALAEGAFERALLRQPAHFGSCYALGLLRMAAGQAADGAELLERALAAGWTEDQRPFALEAWRRCVEAWSGLGRRQDARRAFELGRERLGDSPLARELERSL
jgi:Tfp pilus assembly protein PilF